MSHSPFFIPLSLFIVSLLIVLASSAWFTRLLERVSDLFDLSDSLLSLLGALGANIPNYFASIVALSHQQYSEGLGIIVGSNIYNIAIILSLAALAVPDRLGIVLPHKDARDARFVALHALGIMCLTLLGIVVLSHTSFVAGTLSSNVLLLPICVFSLIVFGMLVYHALHRAHAHQGVRQVEKDSMTETRWVKVRCIAMLALALGIALGGVVVMVQSGQDFANAVGMPPAILGLVILAVATSLPNTVVAYGLARTHRATASVEEIFSSNSINAALGIALPLLIWHNAVHDPLLAYLDAPLMVALTIVALLCVIKRRVSRLTALFLVLLYTSWVLIHVLVH